MNLQEKLERMATTASERQLLRRWLESSAEARPTHDAPPEAANADELTPEPPLATGTHGG